MKSSFQSSKRYSVGTINQIVAYISILPQGDRHEPTNQNIRLTAGVKEGDSSIEVERLSQPVAGGMPLVFSAVGVTLYVAEDVAAAATKIKIKPAAADIANSEIAEDTGKVRLIGGINREITINGNGRNSAIVKTNSSGYLDGGISNNSWEINLKGNILKDDIGFHIISYGAFHAAEGRELFFWQEDFASIEGSFGNKFKGVVAVTKLHKNYPADGIITFNATFTGKGVLKIENESLTIIN